LHEGHLAAVLGEDTLRQIHVSSAGFTIPVPIAGTPFYAVDGDIIAEPQRWQDKLGRTIWERPNVREGARPLAWDKGGRTLMPVAGGGFSSLSDLIAEATTGGKAQLLPYSKGPSGTKVVGRGWSYWGLGSWPPIGAAGGATGTGAALTRTSTGSLLQANAASGDTLHVTTVTSTGNVGTNVLLLYDRLWSMTHTMTVDPRSCDAANPPTRYQTAGTAPGNFISGEVTTVLPAATPTITYTYVDQDGNNVTGSALSTIESGAAVNSVPYSAGRWFYPLAATDVGARSLANDASAVNLSAAMASGVCNWIIGHPLIAIPAPVANIPVVVDGINSAFNLARVYDDACIAFMDIGVGATTTTTYHGLIQLVSG
jgi:hypothetical protein